MPKIPFYIPYGYNEEQDYDSKRGLIEKKLEQSEKNDEEEFSSISAISGSMSSELIANAVYDSDLKSLVFYNSKNEAIASIPVSDIVVSGLIQEAYYDKTTKKIVIVFENGDTIEIDVSDVIDIDEAGDGLVSEDGDIKVLIDPESDDYLTVSSGGVKVAGVDAAISAAVADEQARAEGVESGLADDIAAEETRATGAETTLNQLISAEKTRAMSKEDELANTIANETSRAEGEEGTIKLQIVAEYERAVARENALEDMIEAEEGRATSAETVLNEKIGAETARAEAAEAAISGSVEDEQARAEAAEQALDGKIDAEEVRATSAETVLNEKIEAEEVRATSAETVLNEKIDAEIARAKAAEAAISGASGSVEDEQARAEAAEQALSGLIADETARAEAAETVLNEKIDAEIARAKAAEAAISGASGSVEDEQARAEAAEQALSGLIADEQSRAEDAEQVLDGKIDAEEVRATSAETVLNEKIDAEIARAKAAEAAISGASGSVEDEQARAEAAEQALDGKIDAETARAEAAEQVLSGMVADEQTRAEAAESELQDAIDAEEARAISAETALNERFDGILDGLDYQDTAVVGQYVSEVDETSGVVSVSRVNVSDAPLNGYVSVLSQEEYAGATIDEVNKITSADTINNAFNKIEKIIIADEIVTASGFSKLNQDIAEEIERASGSEATISAAVAAETTRATGAESALGTRITNETTRATDAESALNTSIANEVTRATSAETTIDTKVNTQVVANASYDSNTKLITFTNLNSGTVATINATDFVKDGMIDNVEIKDVIISGETVTCLVITFNTDSGKEEIDIPISDIFDASNYYTKDETDQQIGEAISGLDFSDSAVSGKYVSEVSETDGIVSVSRLNVSEAPLNNFESVFDDPEYTSVTANEEDKIEATDTINQAFNKIERIIIADELVFSASDNALNNKIIAETDRATSAETALGASITAVDGKFANVYTKSQTSGKTELSAEFAKCITSAQVNTLIATAIDSLDYDDTAVTGQYVAKVDEANGVVSMTRANVAEAPLNGFASLYDGAEFSAVTANEANKIASGDTINQAFNKIEATIADNEHVTSAALNDLNDKIAAETDRAEAVEIALSGVVSGLTGEYYTKSETSSKTEISVAFANYYTKSETSSSTEIAEALSHAGEVTSADVETMISTAINGLDFTDVEVSGQYVSKVDEVDGLVSVARKNVVDANLVGYSALTVSDDDISDLDTIVSAIKKLVTALEKNEYVIASALNELNTRVTALENT